MCTGTTMASSHDAVGHQSPEDSRSPAYGEELHCCQGCDRDGPSCQLLVKRFQRRADSKLGRKVDVLHNGTMSCPPPKCMDLVDVR